MMTDSPKSDLIDLVHHEHHHMTRLFEDLRATFERLASEKLEERERLDMLETARDDLASAFEELLHHFDQEDLEFMSALASRSAAS